MFRPVDYYVEQYRMGKRTVERRFEWIEKHSERYPDRTVSKNGGKAFCQDYAWEDMIAHMDMVNAGLNPKFWRPYV